MAKKTISVISTQPTNTGMILVTSYVVLFLVSSVVLHLANTFFPSQVVLGTMSMDRFWSILHSMGTLALITTFAIPFAHLLEQRLGRMLTSQEWMLKYFLVNFIGLWVITRFSDQFGLGIAHWYVAAILALGLDFVQGIAMMSLQKTRTA